LFSDFASFARFLSQIDSLYLPKYSLIKKKFDNNPQKRNTIYARHLDKKKSLAFRPHQVFFIPNDMLCKRWRNTNDELVPGSFIFVPGFRDKKYQLKTKRGQMARFLKSIYPKIIFDIQFLKKYLHLIP
jgi:hypothetical protein